LVIDPETTIELKPDIGEPMLKSGTAKNCISYVCICMSPGNDETLFVVVMIVVDVELRVKAERMFAFV
jgi:hypothetical protein